MSKCGPWAPCSSNISSKTIVISNDFSGVFDALHQSFLVIICGEQLNLTNEQDWNVVWTFSKPNFPNPHYIKVSSICKKKKKKRK